jgi:hypothetical protein
LAPKHFGSFYSRWSERTRRKCPKSSVPMRRRERRVRKALLNLPPYPPSIRILLRVQSVLIQSEALSPSA